MVTAAARRRRSLDTLADVWLLTGQYHTIRFAAMTTALPERIGQYKVLERIGRGGMGTLYRARDPKIGRDIAIKLLREGLDGADLQERFLREARSAGALKHGNIVTIFELGEHLGRPFIAMEFVRGETLATYFKRRPATPLVKKLEYMEQLCAGLHYAHRMGVVHRDIKPANIMIDDEDTVKILDFGIARMGASNMTLTGVLMGTLNYMAPEQMEGKALDARADIFSVGAVLYELFAYRPAFPGDTQSAIMYGVLRGRPEPLEKACPTLDKELIAIVDRCLEKAPEDRYPDLAALQKAIAGVRLRLEQSAQSPTILSGPASGATPRVPTPVPGGARKDSSGVLRSRAEQIRAEQIQSHIDRGRRALEASDHDAAFAACEQALVLDPHNQDALDLEARTRAAVEKRWLAEGRSELDRGSLTSASLLAEGVLSMNAASPEGMALRQAIEEARVRLVEAQERARAFERPFAQAQRDLAAGSLESAAQAIEDALALDATHAEARALREAIAAATTAKRRAEQEARARSAVEQARQLFDRDDHAAAFAVLEGISPAHPIVTDALSAFRREAIDISRRRADAERQRAEAERQRIEAKKKEDEARSAADAVSRARRESDQHLAAAASALEAQNLSEALGRVQMALRADATNERVRELKAKIDAAIVRKQAEASRSAAAAAPPAPAPPREPVAPRAKASPPPPPPVVTPAVPPRVPMSVAAANSTAPPKPGTSGARTGNLLVLGSLAVVAVLLVVIAVLLMRTDRGTQVVDNGGTGLTTSIPSNDDLKRQYLSEATAALRSSDYDTAIRRADQVLGLESGNAEAADIKAKALQARSSIRTVIDTVPPTSVKTSTPTTSVPARPTDNLAERYARASAALDSGAFANAAALLEELQRENPNYRDVGALLARAREGISAAAKQALDAGAKLEAAGDFAGALRQFERVPQLDPSMGATAEQAVSRVKGRMKVAAADALTRARQYDALDRVDDAVTQYERAYRNLTDDDPTKSVVRARLDALRARK